MIEDLIRLAKRLAVFLPGIGITYFVVKDVYPVLDRRLPVGMAMLTTYLFTAYFLIPAGLRLVRIISPPKHVPFYSTTPDGFASDPINIALFGRREDVIKSMTKIGWYVAEPRNLRTIFKLVTGIIFSHPYPTAPFSRLYLLGRQQDLGFQLPVGNNPHHRHHVRFWAVKPDVAENFKQHVAFWQEHHPDKNILDDKYLWLGAASLDIGIGVIRHNAQLTHMIHHDTNAERELIVKRLKQTKQVRKVRKVKIGEPYSLPNRVVRGYLQADGYLTIVELKSA